jgi:glycosyltransferase involved in cell wall biosynthesis
MIDILLAAYNGERFLKEQIDSILLQTCKDWKLLIRDDGSNDNTMNIINDFILRFPNKIGLIKDNYGNLGAAQNFSKLLEKSQSEYIMFCDQDDVWLPEKIALTLNKIKTEEQNYPDTPLLVHTDLKVVDENLTVIAESFWSYNKIDPKDGQVLKKIIYRNVVTGCTAMINRRVKQLITPIPRQVRLHDWWAAMNVAKYGKIFNIPKATVLYRQHSQQAIGAKKEPMTPSVFIRKLKKFFREFSNDYKTIKQIYPPTNIIIFFLNCLNLSIQRRQKTFNVR